MTVAITSELPRSVSDFNEIWKASTGFSLTDTQLHFVQSLPSLVDDHGCGCLEGPAGTGKTATTTAMILAAAIAGKVVAMAAPTHKAANVLGGMLEPWRQRFPELNLPQPVTLHSLLNLRPQRTAEGMPEQFYQKQPPRLHEIDLLIVDECSMIGRELHRYVMEAVTQASVALLYVGDPSQLQPVGEYGLSPTFDQPFKMRLTEVLRHDGAILNLATRARKIRCPQVLPDSGGGSVVVTYRTPQELQAAWLERLKAVDNPEDVVMLCWRNKTRREMNLAARACLYGESVPPYMRGDTLVTLSPVMRGEQIVLPNNYTFTVTEAVFDPAYAPPVPGLDMTFAVWELLLQSGERIRVLDDASEGAYQHTLRRLKKEISTASDAAQAALKAAETAQDPSAVQKARNTICAVKDRWREEYFPLKECFASVDFGYVCTVHKSQGSTYPYTFVWFDYMQSREQQALGYVAITRASKELHHLHVARGFVMPS